MVLGYIINGLDTGGTAEELRHRVHRFADSNQNQPNWYSLSAFEADAIVASILKYHEIQPGGTVGPPRVPVETQTTTTRRSDPDTTVPHVAFPQSVTEGSKRRRVQTVEEMPSVEEKEHVEKDTGR